MTQDQPLVLDPAVASEHGLTVATIHALLHQDPAMSDREIARRIRVNQSTVSRTRKVMHHASEPTPTRGAPSLQCVPSTSVKSGVDTQGVTPGVIRGVVATAEADSPGVSNTRQTPAPVILLEAGQTLEPTGGQVLVPLAGGQTLVLPQGQPLESLEGHSLVPAAGPGKPKAKPKTRKPRPPKVWAPKPALHLVDPTFPDPSVPPEDSDLDLGWADLAQGSRDARWLVSYLASKIDTKAVASRAPGWVGGGRWNQMTPPRALRNLKWADRLLGEHTLYKAVLVVDYVFDSGWLGANPVADNGYAERYWSQSMEGGRRVTGLYQILINFDELVAARAQDIEGNNYDPEVLVGSADDTSRSEIAKCHFHGSEAQERHSEETERQQAAQPREPTPVEELREKIKAWHRKNDRLARR